MALHAPVQRLAAHAQLARGLGDHAAGALKGRLDLFALGLARRGLAPQVLSRAVEDSGTVTSVLIPWNTCGAYISGVLGVSTAAYVPYCFFNILSPLLDVLYGYLGFKVPKAEHPWAAEARTQTIPTVPDDPGPGGKDTP